MARKNKTANSKQKNLSKSIASSTGKAQATPTPKRKRGNPSIVQAGAATQFKSNDPETGFIDERINRKGYLKPRSHREFETLIDRLFDEEIEIENPITREKETMTELYFAIKRLIRANNVQGAMYLMDRRFGPVRKTADPEAEGRGQGGFVLPAHLVAPDFLATLRDVIAGGHTEYLEYGGRGSTKSSFISLVIIYLLLNNSNMHAAIIRQVKDTLRDSVYSQLIWAIDQLELNADFHCTVSPLEITYIPTGQKIYFRGADDPVKLKSIKPPFGYIGVAWFEELDQFHGADAIRNIEQSLIRGGDNAYIFKSWNPPKTNHNWVNKYILIPKETQHQHKSTYLTVPTEWLGKTFLMEAEHLQETNPSAYENEYLGIVNGVGGMVFDNVKLRTIKDAEIKEFDNQLNGLDWGYFPEPYAFAKMHYDSKRRTLYVFDELVMLKASNKDTYNKLVKEKGITPQDEIIADSAESKSIADYKEFGLYCRGAEKGKESVKYSMKWLQSLAAIVIDPKRAPTSSAEFTGYEYERDKNGDIISGYPEGNDHCIAAVRYGTNRIWKRRGE